MDTIGSSLREPLQNVAVACIGPVTAKTAEQHGLNVAIQAEEFTVDGLIQAMEGHFKK